MYVSHTEEQMKPIRMIYCHKVHLSEKYLTFNSLHSSAYCHSRMQITITCREEPKLGAQEEEIEASVSRDTQEEESEASVSRDTQEQESECLVGDTNKVISIIFQLSESSHSLYNILSTVNKIPTTEKLL